MDDKEYLEEGFDPKSLKVTQLRGILNEYDVEYPSNAKKSQLVELFNESILPRSSELAKDYKAKVANSNDVGFIDVQTEVVETEKAKKEKKKRIVKTKKSTEFVPEGKQSPVNVPAIPEVEKNIAIQNDTPVKKEESLDIEDSPFTTENVFQSPKSPSSASKGKKRQSEGPTSKEKRIKSPVDVTSIPEDKTPRSKKTKDKVAIKSIFDDDDDDEILGISKSPVKASLTLPKVEKVEKLETPVADKKIKSPKPIEAATPKSSKKDLLFASDEKLEAPAVKQSSKEKPSKVVKATPKKNTPIKTDKSPKSPVSSVKAATPRSSKKSQSTRSKSSKVDLSLNSNNSFKSVQEEVDDFDQELQRIKNTAPPSIDMQLAQELGISVQGIPSPFAKSPAISTPKQNVARTTSAITPKPRLVPINQAISELSEEDDDEEEEVDDDAEIEKIDQKITKIEQELDEENAIKKVKTAPHPKLGPLFLTFLTWIILVSAGLFGYWYREQTFLIGYCGEEINKPTFPDTDNKVLKTVGNYLDENLKPVCVPCPSHARCFPNLELGCFEDFVELRPWDNFIKPYNKKCIPDTKKAEKLEIMIDVALDLLRSKNAQTQCGQSSNNEEAGIKLDDLHDLLLSMKAPYITIEEFEELWERSILELEKEPEVIAGYPSIPSKGVPSNTNDTVQRQETDKVLRSTSLSNLSIKCQLHYILISSLLQYKYYLISVLVIIAAIKYAQFAYQRYKVELLKVDIIYKEVINKLQYQAKLSNQVHGKIKPHIGANQLRDLILANEHNLKRRINLWSQVNSKVENNTNISSQLIEDHGEIMRVWQWISELAQ